MTSIISRRRPRATRAPPIITIHIKQLTVMHAITGRDAFALARRWATFQEGMSGRLRAYAEKTAFIARRKLI